MVDGRWAGQLAVLNATIEARMGADAPLPAGIEHHARRIVLDTLGCALAGRQAPEVAALERQAAVLEPGRIRLPGGAGLGLHPAARLLAIGATWHEACEGHAFAHGRPGIATMAALLPLALARDATVGAFIDAFVLGYEVAARAGGWLRIKPGLHVDGTWPGLGVAAGVARLLGLDAGGVRCAVDIVACQMPNSLYLPIRTGRNVRNTYLAHSATLGLDAALAAQAGFDAPPDALAWVAEHGFQAATAPIPAADRLLIADGYLKPFAAVRHVHYGALAAQRIRTRIRERLGGSTDGIERILLEVYEEATVYCDNPRPASLLAAQFSLTFGVAAMLQTGDLGPASYSAAVFDDASLRRLEAMVEVRVDPALTAAGRRGATLTVWTAQGSLQQTVAEDDPELVPSPQGIRARFIESAADGAAPGPAADFHDGFVAAAADLPLRRLWAGLAGGDDRA